MGNLTVVAHNLMGINANRQLGITTKKQGKTAEKLSSGYKINRAADDAAGLSISEKMRKQIRGLTQGVENTQDGISLCQVADGALSEVGEMLHRISELSVKAANGTNSDEDRKYIQEEITQLLTEVNRVSYTTSFNERLLFSSGGKIIPDRSPASFTNDEIIDCLFKATYPKIETDVIEADIDERISVSTANDMLKVLSQYVTSQTIYENNWRVPRDSDILREIFIRWHYDQLNECLPDYENGSEEEEAYKLYMEQSFEQAMTAFDTGNRRLFARYSESGGLQFCLYGSPGMPGLFRVGDFCSYLGAPNNIGTGNFRSYNALAKYSGPAHARDSSNMMQKRPLPGEINRLWYEMSPLTEIGFPAFPHKFDEACNLFRHLFTNQETVYPEKLDHSLWIQSGADAYDGMMFEIPQIDTEILGIDDLSVTSQQGADAAIEKTTFALKTLAESRSIIGAWQNRLEHTINNEDNVIENTTSAESLIRDTDMAKEVVAHSIQNILQQAGQAMLSQANQSNQIVLSLLK